VRAYYNEFDPYAAQWLRNLIAAGHIPEGDVDERDIRKVSADDIRGYTQCHFFAGIGGWSIALRSAGWPDDRPVWTGSCPCQPYSSAGKQEGISDDRHLWPDWYRLIRECRPAVILGEQVAGAIAFGWLDEVLLNMEAEAYACAASVLPACAAGAFHRRDRVWFVGYSKHDGRDGLPVAGSDGEDVSGAAQGQDSSLQSEGAGESCNVADTQGIGSRRGLCEGRQKLDGDGITSSGSAGSTMGISHIEGLEGQSGYGKNTTGGAERDTTSSRAKSLLLTPSANEDAAGTVTGKMQKMLTHQAKEANMEKSVSSGSSAPTENQGQLAPEFVCWLMGYPIEHLNCAPTETPSTLKSLRNSSKQP
jgi:site-specific DNA-cytosine methylase